MVEFEPTQETCHEGEVEQHAVRELLSEFRDIFGEPKGLPLKRNCDHAIRLISGATPPNLRPYRYPYHQKDEIKKKIVKEMPSAGDIKPSMSPFTSLIILIRKEDGG